MKPKMGVWGVEWYFTEFLAKLNFVTVPKGETLQVAFERAKHREPTLKGSPDSASGSAVTGKPLSRASRNGGGSTLHAMPNERCEIVRTFLAQDNLQLDSGTKTLEVLKLAEAAIPNARAARYFYVE